MFKRKSKKMSYDTRERKRKLNAPAGNDPNAKCAKGETTCTYNKFDQCIYCGKTKGHRLNKQHPIKISKKDRFGIENN
jgi:hypothetical protein